MNTKRKAELQRKLSMTSVPKPPAGLADRIKAGIPEDLLSTQRDRERLSRSTAYSMRVAASILLLISSVYLALQLMTRSGQKPSGLTSAPTMDRVQAPPTSAVAPAAAPQAEVTITFADKKKEAFGYKSAEADNVRQNPKPATKAEAVLADNRKRDLAKDQESTRNDVERRAGVESGISGGRLGEVAVADAAPAPAAPVAAPAAPPARIAAAETLPAEEPQSAQTALRAEGKVRAQSTKEAITVTGAAPSIVDGLNAAELSFASPRAVFGLSIDPGAFDRVKHDIEKGARPAAGSIDVAALVNYFAGPARPPRRDVRLDVEASRAPLAANNTASLRFTIDTPREIAAPGASLPPVATDAELEIWVNSQAVQSHRIVGARELTAQATLVKNLSVTGIVDMKLKPGLPPRTTIATLTLRYRSVEDGKKHTIRRAVHAADVARTWASATRRHRLATLGAVWSETLNAGTTEGDVARTAKRLATEAPGDERAQDLAEVASASSRLRSFGPTGSAR
ncbi:MAG: hypothetical protein ACXW2F_01880 [Thermoanaerobaculia bacterium]